MTLWVTKCSPIKHTSKLFSLFFRKAAQKDLWIPKCLPSCVFQHCACWQMVIKNLFSATSSVEHLLTIRQFLLSPLVDPLDAHNVWITNIFHFFIPFWCWALKHQARRSNVRQYMANEFRCKFIKHFHLALLWFLSPWNYPFGSNCILSFSRGEHLSCNNFKHVSAKQSSF